MEFSTFGSDPPTHPPNVEKKIKFWPSKWAFQTIRNKKFFHPLKVEKYIENFHTHPKEHQRVRGRAAHLDPPEWKIKELNFYKKDKIKWG